MEEDIATEKSVVLRYAIDTVGVTKRHRYTVSAIKIISDTKKHSSNFNSQAWIL